jgi:hypothetical protein
MQVPWSMVWGSFLFPEMAPVSQAFVHIWQPLQVAGSTFSGGISTPAAAAASLTFTPGGTVNWAPPILITTSFAGFCAWVVVILLPSLTTYFFLLRLPPHFKIFSFSGLSLPLSMFFILFSIFFAGTAFPSGAGPVFFFAGRR